MNRTSLSRRSHIWHEDMAVFHFDLRLRVTSILWPLKDVFTAINSKKQETCCFLEKRAIYFQFQTNLCDYDINDCNQIQLVQHNLDPFPASLDVICICTSLLWKWALIEGDLLRLNL